MAAPAAPAAPVAVPAVPVWAPRYANFAALDAVLVAAAPARYGANNGVATGAGTFQAKWQAAMTANAAPVNVAAEEDSIVVLVLLLKQLGIYNGVVLRRLEYGAGADAATGEVAGAGLPAVAGGVAGNDVNNPLPANTIAQIVDHALECWHDRAADACDAFIFDVRAYINDKLALHPSADGMPAAWKNDLVRAAYNLVNLGSTHPRIAVPHDVAGIAGTQIDAGLALPTHVVRRANPFDRTVVGALAPAAFGGAAAKKSKKAVHRKAKKAAKKTKKATKSRKAVKRVAKKAVRKTAKRTTRKH